MRYKIFALGLVILLFSVIVLDFPSSDKVSSILETYYDCAKGTDDLRAAFLMSQGYCELAKPLFWIFLILAFLGFIITIIGLVKKQKVVQNTY